MCAAEDKSRTARALTMLEMVIAMAIMAVVFSAILPQFRNINNSWTLKKASAEMLQNGRVFTDHIRFSLARAVKITAVSAPADSTGFIEFTAGDGNTYRYDISASGYVQYGQVGDPADLAGPVSRLQFSCYSLDDLDTPITDVKLVRFVKVTTTMVNTGSMGHDKTFTAQAHLQTNAFADPVEFGNSVVGPMQERRLSATMIATQVDLPQTIILTGIKAYIKDPPPKDVRYAVYTNNGNKPGSLIVETSVFPGGANVFHWRQESLPPTPLNAGTYWLVLCFEHNNMYYKFGTSGRTYMAAGAATTNGYPATWPAASSFADYAVNIAGVTDSTYVMP